MILLERKKAMTNHNNSQIKQRIALLKNNRNIGKTADKQIIKINIPAILSKSVIFLLIIT